MIAEKYQLENICVWRVWFEHSPNEAPTPAKRLQRPGIVSRGLPIFTREGATQEQW